MSDSGSRRSANPSAFADEASSHWRSSIASTSPSSARSSSALRTATPSARWSTGRSFCVLDEQRHLERPALGRRQRRQRVVEDAVEQVAEADVRKRTLRFGGPRREHAEPTPAGVLDGGAPERRLPDPGLAFERDCDRAFPGAVPVEERRQRAELLFPPDDVDCHSTSIVTWALPEVPQNERPRPGPFASNGECRGAQTASTAAAPIGAPTAFERDSARPGARRATKSAPRSRSAAPAIRPLGEAVQEGGLSVEHELVALRPQVIADLLGRGKRPAGLLAGAGGQAAGRVGHLGAVDAVHQASEHSDPERTAELAGDVVDRRGDALLAPRQRRHDRRRRRCSASAMPAPKGKSPARKWA